jgi:transglutaminase-like putative cysteine protease
VLNDENGDDLETAVLLASFMRAVNIPTRIASGVTSTGEFEPWCWIECYVGEWIPFDASQGDPWPWMDATYIKLAEGEASDAKLGLKLAAKVKVEVKQVDYADPGTGPTTLPAGTIFTVNSNGGFDIKPPGSVK